MNGGGTVTARVPINVSTQKKHVNQAARLEAGTLWVHTRDSGQDCQGYNVQRGKSTKHEKVQTPQKE